MNYATVSNALIALSGGVFVGIDTETKVTLKGGKKNPLQGRVTKRTSNATVMCFSNAGGSAYDNMVKRRLTAEGKDPDSFKLGDRAWGERIAGTPFIEHKGKHYLEVIFMRAGTTVVMVDGVETDKDTIEGMPVASTSGQGGLENQVIIRTYALDSLVGLRASGTEWK
jgi:hypothetical protein